MGSKTNSFETSVLNLVFNNTDIANIGDAAGLQNSVTAGNLFVALCTDATASSDASAGTECVYGGYTRVAVSRSGGWTVSGNTASNTAAVTFVVCGSGTENVRYFEIWTASTGGSRLYWTQLTADLAVSVGIRPEFAIGTLTIVED